MRDFQQRTISSEEWATPLPLFRAVNDEYAFTLDACASVDNAKCKRFYTKEDNALGLPWPGVVWMNPPYGKTLPEWIAKARQESQSGSTVVCLVPARVDTAWWHDYVIPYATVKFIRGRVRFIGAPFNAPFPSALVIFKPTKEGDHGK